MRVIGQDSLKTRRTLAGGGRNYEYHSVPEIEGKISACSDALFGTDSHTTMARGIGMLG